MSTSVDPARKAANRAIRARLFQRLRESLARQEAAQRGGDLGRPSRIDDEPNLTGAEQEVLCAWLTEHPSLLKLYETEPAAQRDIETAVRRSVTTEYGDSL